MADYEALKARVDELAARAWDVAAIEARVKKMVKEGIPKKYFVFIPRIPIVK